MVQQFGQGFDGDVRRVGGGRRAGGATDEGRAHAELAGARDVDVGVVTDKKGVAGVGAETREGRLEDSGVGFSKTDDGTEQGDVEVGGQAESPELIFPEVFGGSPGGVRDQAETVAAPAEGQDGGECIVEEPSFGHEWPSAHFGHSGERIAAEAADHASQGEGGVMKEGGAGTGAGAAGMGLAGFGKNDGGRGTRFFGLDEEAVETLDASAGQARPTGDGIVHQGPAHIKKDNADVSEHRPISPGRRTLGCV